RARGAGRPRATTRPGGAAGGAGGRPAARGPGSPAGAPQAGQPGTPGTAGGPARRRPGTASGPPRRSPGTPAPLLLLRRPLLALRGLGGGPAHARNRWHPGDAATAEHLPHHLLAFLEPDDQVVHLTDRGPRALRDACPPGPVEDLRAAPRVPGDPVL